MVRLFVCQNFYQNFLFANKNELAKTITINNNLIPAIIFAMLYTLTPIATSTFSLDNELFKQFIKANLKTQTSV